MIELRNFTKFYGGRAAVEDFSLSCAEGEITALLGPNGAGKTTVLKAVCARHFATSGSVVVGGVDAAEEAERVRAATGFVEESASLPGELTVREFISLRAEMLAAGSSAAEEVKKTCSLGEIWGERIRSLSKGQRERVNFAQALVHDPKILVLDEPASGLDPAQIVRMRRLVLSLRKGRTILLSTHLMQEVAALADRICVMSRGRAAAFGTAEEIAAQSGAATLEEAFFALTT